MFLLLLLTLMSSPIPSEGEREFYDVQILDLGQTAQLYCNESKEYPNAPNMSQPIAWMLPNLTILDQSKDRFQLTMDNLTLEVVNVTKEDLGLYHCMLTAENVTWYLCRAGLNAGGPYFEDLWAKYDLNTIIGISAFFGFLALAIATWLLYHFRYIDPDKVERESRVWPHDVRLPSVVVEDHGVIKVIDGDDRSSHEGSRKDVKRKDSNDRDRQPKGKELDNRGFVADDSDSENRSVGHGSDSSDRHRQPKGEGLHNRGFVADDSDRRSRESETSF
jgi:hypothetical protein